jgi:hypothetical protein
VKPIHLNLAARPYRNYLPVNLVVVAASLLIAFLALYNVDTFIRYRTETVATRAKIAKLEAETAREQRLADDAVGRVKAYNVTALQKQTRFVNAQIAERAFSWSELLDRLESILAPNTRITSIQPAFDKAAIGVVHLELLCEAKTGDSLVDMINRFNRDARFSNPFPRVETATPTGYTFSIGVDYRPTLPGSAAAAPAASAAPAAYAPAGGNR